VVLRRWQHIHSPGREMEPSDWSETHAAAPPERP
jgi:hypothetical protein